MSSERISEEFVRMFGEPPDVITVAPGRVNLIGEHTDYNDGYVFPAAIDRNVWIAAVPSDASEYISLELGKAGQSWTKYPEGVASVLRSQGHRIPNLRAVVTSDVPIGAGISSSAALELAFCVAWNELATLGLSSPAMARVGQQCENEYIGLKSGLMDQMASAMGRAGNAMFYDTRSGEITYCKIPDGIVIVIAHTTKSRELASSKYNERREECMEAARVMGVPTLRDATLELLEASAFRMTDVCFSRARHVITENERCISFATALNEGALEELGYLMDESHKSLRLDYEVSCLELDAMASACRSASGCIGARMTGAGFGGACVALVSGDNLDAFFREAGAQYTQSTGLIGQFMICKAADGARKVP